MSTISASTTTTTAYKVAADTTGTLVFQTGATPTTAVTIDGSQNVGVGATPSAWSTSFRGFQVGGAGCVWSSASGFGGTYIGNNYYYSASGRTYLTTNTAVEIALASGGIQFSIAPSGTAGTAASFTQAMTLDASGNFLLGTTSQIGTGKVNILWNGTTANAIELQETSSASGAGFLSFRRADATQIGSVTRVGTTAAVVYNTTSDYRLKTVLGSVSGSGERIDALKPIDYQWTEDGSNARGFLAHEFKEVYANSVTGEKDAVDADGNPVYQAMQASTPEVIADLVAEIQSLRKRLAALENK